MVVLPEVNMTAKQTETKVNEVVDTGSAEPTNLPEVVEGNTRPVAIPPPPKARANKWVPHPIDKVKSRKWCITDFDLTHVDLMRNLVKGYKASYCCFQIEVCPKTNRDHIQGYVRFNEQKTGLSMRKLLVGAHIESQWAKVDKCAYDYCKKERTAKDGHKAEEYGVRPSGQGARTELIAINKKIRQVGINAMLRESDAYDNEYVRYKSGWQDLERRVRPVVKRKWMTKATYVFGQSWIGKSYWCKKQAEAAGGGIFDKKSTMKQWWDGYEGEDNVIMDDHAPDALTIHEWLSLIDESPCTLQLKGGSTQFISKEIYVSQNININEYWNTISSINPVHIQAWLRRFTRVFEFIQEKDGSRWVYPYRLDINRERDDFGQERVTWFWVNTGDKRPAYEAEEIPVKMEEPKDNIDDQGGDDEEPVASI